MACSFADRAAVLGAQVQLHLERLVGALLRLKHSAEEGRELQPEESLVQLGSVKSLQTAMMEAFESAEHHLLRLPVRVVIALALPE